MNVKQFKKLKTSFKERGCTGVHTINDLWYVPWCSCYGVYLCRKYSSGQETKSWKRPSISSKIFDYT
jgi:hypothetical protein